MKNFNQIAKKSRFEVADNGFTGRVIGNLTALEQPQRMVLRRVSVWREFCLPMIGVSAAVLLFGFMVTRVVDVNALYNNCIDKTEKIIADRLNETSLQKTDKEVINPLK